MSAGAQRDKAFAYIKAWLAETGEMPSRQSLANYMGWKNGCASDLLCALVRQKRLRRIKNPPKSKVKYSYEIIQ